MVRNIAAGNEPTLRVDSWNMLVSRTSAVSCAVALALRSAWKFKVRLEAIDPSLKKLCQPRMLEKVGKAPEQYPHADW